MTTIPEACLQFTSVFRTLRWEHALSLLVGLAIGALAERWRDR